MKLTTILGLGAAALMALAAAPLAPTYSTAPWAKTVVIAR